MSVLYLAFLMRSADENVLVNLVCEFRTGHFQAVLSLLFNYTYNVDLYEPKVGIYYEGRPESKDRLCAGVLLPERENLAGKFLSIQHMFHTCPRRFSLSH